MSQNTRVTVYVAEFEQPSAVVIVNVTTIGNVTEAQVTDEGIKVVIQLVKPDEVESDELKKRLQEAWDSIKTGLVRGLSIGFRGLEAPERLGEVFFQENSWIGMSSSE